MRYCFYIGTCLLLIIVQTTFLSYFDITSGIYDLLIPFVIFLSVCLPVRECLPFILVLGFIVDNLSGSPFGLYLTFYFWLFAGIRWIIQYLRAGNKLFLSLVVIVAVLIQNILVLGIFSYFGPIEQLPTEVVKNIALQIFWAVVTGPLFLLSLFTIAKRFNIQLNGAGAAPKT
ncbi:MAG: rod shape-determining protein MreD [Desulfobacterales bacterium]|jgi:cell shape-determining protein MreD